MTTAMILRPTFTAICFLLISYPVMLVKAQTKPPTVAPKPPESDAVQDSLKVFIEEVLIPVSATDTSGRFDPTVGLQDLMVKEDGVVQQLKSVYRVPANVLLLLDTGTGPNSPKDVRLTKVVAQRLVSGLHRDDRIGIIQVNNRVELIQDWTPSQADALRSIDDKLLPGKDSALVAGLVAAVKQFQTIPSGNGHLVFITDGIDRATSQTNFTEAFYNLVPANITVHIISYASLGTNRGNPIPTRLREKSAVDKHLIEALPSGRFKENPTPDLKTIMQAKGGVVLDVDRVFPRKGIKEQLKQREKEFLAIAEETGGNLWLPGSADEMIDRASEVAQLIDSQYVISYKPLRPLTSITASEYRSIDVVARRVGLNVRARRGYLAKIHRSN